MEEIRSIISNNLQALRKAKNLTLQELSDKTGVSKSMLGEIERGVTNPTITVLWRISKGLKVPFSMLIQKEKPEITVVRDIDKKVFREEEKYKISSIFEFDPSKKFEIFHLEFSPGSRFESKGHNEGVEEYILLYEGQLIMEIDNSRFVLEPGDSFLYKAEKPHVYINESNHNAEAYNIVFYGINE